jgi:hypothetical protein
MKKVLCLAWLVVLLATGISSAKVPDLLGRWTGSWSGYDEGKGYSNSNASGIINYTFVEQKDRIFAGNLTIMLKDGTEINQGFAGAIGLDNKTLYIIELDLGYSLGTVISNNEIELMFLTDGENASVAIDELHRVKNDI